MLAPKAAGFITREAAGLRPPKSVSHNINPGLGGVALHYGGSNVPTSSHADAKSRWRAWQDYHMDNHGWVDIAYTMGVDNWGFVYAGRGVGVRTAANGTNFGNSNYYAICWIGGERQNPTQAALAAIMWAVQALRDSGAGLDVRPHSAFKSTSCCGTDLRPFAWSLNGHEFAPEPEPEPDEWEVFYMSLNEKEKQVLHDFARAIEEEGTNARSFVRQLLIRHRDDIPALQSHVERVDSLVETAQTSLQGVIIGGINAVDAVRDAGYIIRTDMRTGPMKETS